MRLKQLILAILVTLTLTCCNGNKEQFFNDWNALIVKVSVEENLSEEELQDIRTEYERLCKEQTRLKNELTVEEKEQLNQLRSQYTKAYARQTTEELIDSFQGIIEVAGTVFEELTRNINKGDLQKSLEEIVNNIDTTAISDIANNLKNASKEKSPINVEQIEKVASGLGAIGAVLSGEPIEKIDIKELKKNISEEDVRKIANSLTKEDIEALKKSITKEDIKKIKESLSESEIKRLKEIYKELNK